MTTSALPTASTVWKFTDSELAAPYIDGNSAMVYVLHFSTPYHHARHYIGIAHDGDVQRRLREHLTGRGSPLVYAATLAGIVITVSLALPGDLGLERRMHNRHGTRICPLCNQPELIQTPLL